MKVLLFTIFYLASFSFIVAQEATGNFPPPKTKREVKATRTSSTIKIDGKLNESAWQAAETISDFFRIEPRQGGKYKYRTEVKVLYDDKNLYIGAFCADSLGKDGVRVQDLRRDFVRGENDIFSIQLDPQNLKQYAVSFQTTPFGNQLDLQNFNDQVIDTDWNALWSVRTSQTSEGYYAEFAIPFKSLRYNATPEGKEVKWGITFSRLARREYEQTVFPAIPQSFSPYRMTYAANLTNLEIPEPSANIRVEPYTLYNYERSKADGNTTNRDDFKLGGEVKWAVNPNAVLDFTFNTDFAQADVDRAVNNLERFNIFFPERRQFFLENSGLWAGGRQTSIRPFFSRRIGLQGNFNAATARIDAGTRFTLRDENKAIAGLYMHQAATENSSAANFMVGRYLKNYGRENNIGVMITHRLDEASGSLNLNQQNNSTITIDGLLRPSSIWSINYLATVSIDHELNKAGFAGRIFAGRSANKSYWGWVTELTTSTYNPAMGFVRQRNVIRHNPGGYFILRPKKLTWMRRWDPGFFADFYHDASDPGKFQQGSLYLFPIYVFFTDGSFFEYSLTPTWQNINFNFAPLGISITQDRYFYTRHAIRFNTDQSKKWSLNGRFEWGNFYNGKRENLSSGIRLVPDPHLAFTFDYGYNRLRALGEDNQNLETHLSTVGARLAVNPRLQLSSFYQYNTFDKQGRWNVRLSWEYQPLSFLYVVFNDRQIRGLDNPFQEQQFIAKLTFLKQF